MRKRRRRHVDWACNGARWTLFTSEEGLSGQLLWRIRDGAQLQQLCMFFNRYSRAKSSSRHYDSVTSQPAPADNLRSCLDNSREITLPFVARLRPQRNGIAYGLDGSHVMRQLEDNSHSRCSIDRVEPGTDLDSTVSK